MNNVPPPFLVSYSMTSRCNLACKHCYSESTENTDSDDLTTEESFRLTDQLAGWGIGLLIFDGGEPSWSRTSPG